MRILPYSHVLVIIGILLIGSIAVISGSISQVHAATGINKQINFQGKVVNSDGTNVSDGTYRFQFRLYTVSSGGVAVWEEDWDGGNKLQVSGGIFRASLGSITSLPGSVDFNTDNIYLSIQFHTESSEMTPRVRFTAVPYAFNALKVAGLTVTDTTGTFTLAGSKTFTVNNTLTFSGTDGTVFTFPSSTGNVVTEGFTQTLTNKTIGSTGLVFSGATTDITTASNEDFVINPVGNGNIGIGTTSPHGYMHVSGGIAGGRAALVVNQSGASTNDIFTASASGVTKFILSNGGNLSLTAGSTIDAITSGALSFGTGTTTTGITLGKSGGSITIPNFIAKNSVLYGTETTGVLAAAATDTASQCLLSGASAPAWGSCGGGGSNNFWQLPGQGVLTPGNLTTDLLMGGVTTASAKFAVLNMANGTPIASLSATGTTDRPAIYLSGSGGISTVNKGTLTIGSTDTGIIDIRTGPGLGKHIYLNGGIATDYQSTIFLNNVGGAVKIGGNTDPIATLDLQFTAGATSQFSKGFYANLTSGSNVGTLAPLASFKLTNSASMNPDTNFHGLDIDFLNNPSVAANTETALTIRNLLTTNTTDNATDTLLLLDNADTTDTGTTIVTDAIKITNSGGSGFTNFLNTPTVDISATGVVSGVTGLTFSGAGFTGKNSILYAAETTGVVTAASTNTGSQCLLSGASAPAWGSCGGGSSNWTVVNGSIRPNQATILDLLLGGDATTSSKFAVLNIGNGTPVASVSTGLSGTAMSFSADGSIQTANQAKLTIGGTTTGNIQLLAKGTAQGNVQVGTGVNDNQTPDLLVVDYGAGDPAVATNGAMFYNTLKSRFRCYQAGAWKDCDSSGKSGVYVVKASDEASPQSTTALQDDNELFFRMEASQTYYIEMAIYIDLNNSNADLRYGWTVPSGAVIDLSTEGASNTTTAVTNCNYLASAQICPIAISSTQITMIRVHGIVVNGSTAGNFQFQFSQANSTAADAPVVKAGSLLRAERVLGADLAEVYYTNDSDIDSGDLVDIDSQLIKGVKKSDHAYSNQALGIVTTKPGIVLGESGMIGKKPVAIALSGRVPLKISHISDKISAGDFLTTSNEEGKAMKATKAGYVIAKALEDWNPSDPKDKILVFIERTFYDPIVTLLANEVDLGGITLSTIPPTEIASARYSIKDSLNNVITNLGVFSESIISHLTAGVINARQINTDSIRIGGKTLQEFILDIAVQSSDSSVHTADIKDSSIMVDGLEIDTHNTDGNVRSNSGISSHIVVDTIESASSSAISMRLTNGKSFVIKNNDHPVALFDISGNATFAGTLHAASIDAGTIKNLDQHVQGEIRKTFGGTVASGSGSFAFVDGLSVTGPSVFETIDIMDVLRIGTNMLFGQGSINVLGGNLELQSLKQGGISFLSGVIYIDQSGDISIMGNTVYDADVLFKRDVEFEGHVLGSSDIVGSITIPQGSRAARVEFKQEYKQVPFIQLTPEFNATGNNTPWSAVSEDKYNYVIVDKNKKGFGVLLNNEAEHDITFSYFIMSGSGGSSQEIHNDRKTSP